MTSGNEMSNLCLSTVKISNQQLCTTHNHQKVFFLKIMSLFRFQWLRRFVRKHTNYIPEESASLWKARLSVVYMLLSWNAFGLVVYMIYKGKNDWAQPYKSESELNLTPGTKYIEKLKNKSFYFKYL